MQMESPQISTHQPPTIWFSTTAPHNFNHHFAPSPTTTATIPPPQLVHVTTTDDVTKHHHHRLVQQYIPAAASNGTTCCPPPAPTMLLPHGHHLLVQQIIHPLQLQQAPNFGTAGATPVNVTSAPTAIGRANVTSSTSGVLPSEPPIFQAPLGSESSLMIGAGRPFHQAPAAAPAQLQMIPAASVVTNQHRTGQFNAKLSLLQHQKLEISMNDVLAHKTIISSKSQRKKKISPSAKRRSRKRLEAFLEAKRKKDSCPTIAEQVEPSLLNGNETTASPSSNEQDELIKADNNTATDVSPTPNTLPVLDYPPSISNESSLPDYPTSATLPVLDQPTSNAVTSSQLSEQETEL